MKHFIYIITNKITNKQYIGQTNNFERRIKQHCKPSGKSYISKAIQKYGKGNFTFEEVVCCFSEADVNFLEEMLINEKNTLLPFGYNIERGGNNFSRVIGSMQGKKHSTETKNKISFAHLGKIVSEKTKQKMSISKLGVSLTKQTIEKIRTSNLGRTRNEKKLIHVPSATIFKNAKEACFFLNCSNRTLTRKLDPASKYFSNNIITYYKGQS